MEIFIKNLFFIAISLIVINSAYSQTEEVSPPHPDFTPAKTSMVNRMSLKYQMTAGFIGREYIENPLTFSLGYYLDSSNIITLRYSNFNGSDVDNKAAIKLRAVTLGYRHFVGNSFNYMPTIYYRRNTIDYKNEGQFVIFGPSNLIYEDIGAGIRLGNEWQWENFTMGCDWFGVNRTVIELNYKQQSAGILDELNFEKQWTLTLFSFYLGYSF